MKDNSNNIRAKYVYDAWGNHKVYNASGVEQTSSTFVGNINPIRYRGYYYDTESDMYYCKSRYYKPQINRWINMDDISYLDKKNINGFNLYAYCNNNPVNMADMFGNSPTTILESALFTSVGGTITQIVVSSIGYVAAAGWALGDLIFNRIFNRGKGAWADMCNINWNPFNTNENKVMNSKYLSFYKGVPVLQVSEMGGSMSLRLIFFDKNQGIEVLKHERGHNTQLMSIM